ncbi:MAG: ROK family protein [Sphaerochaetaceae bacterium]
MADYPATRMRDDNRKRVFDFIRREKIVTRTMIQKEISISSPTVMKIVKFFEEKRIVTPYGELSKDGPGRKLEQLQFNSKAAYAIGIVFEGHFLHVGVVSLGGEIVFSDLKYYEQLDSLEVASSDLLIPVIQETLQASTIAVSSILGVGLGIPKIADTQAQSIHSFYHRETQYSYKEISLDIERAFGFPLFVENDVNAETIGEYYLRNLPLSADLLYMSLGSGLGAGLILEGSIRRGFHFSAGEIGHMLTNCTDDVVQFEDLVGLQTIRRKWHLSSTDTLDTVKASTQQEIIAYLAKILSWCIVNVVVLLDVDLMVLGGITAQALGDDLIAAIKGYTSELLTFDIDLQASDSSKAGLVGSAMMVIDNCLDTYLGG